MYKHTIFLFLTFILGFEYQLLAQTTTFDFFLQTNATEGVGIAYENDNGYYYLLAGREDTISPKLYSDIMLLKLSQTGDTMVRLERSPDTSVGLRHLIKTDSIFLGIGFYDFNDTSSGGLYNITFNDNLNILTKRTVKFPDGYNTYLSAATHILTDKESNYIFVVSLTEPYNNQGFDAGDICFYKYNEIGDTINTHILKMDKGQLVEDVCFNSDSTEIWLFGSGFREGVHQWVKFDLDFNLLSIEEFYQNADYPFSILQESTNSWVGCGSFSVFDRVQDDDLWVFRMDSLGNILNDIVLGAQDTIDYAAYWKSFDFSKEGEIFISGTHNVVIAAFPKTSSWVMLTKLDSTFKHKFTRYYNPDGMYYSNIGLNVCNDGGVILSSQRYDYDNDDVPDNWDAWVLKVDGNGYMTGQDDKPNVQTKNALLYPNPGGDRLWVSCGWPSAVLILYNMNGQAVLKKKLIALTTTVNTSSLPKGNYTWTIKVKENKIIEKGKWIKNN
ncbi:MAG: T9SS type A sorting domain-containing protein [Bacteroidales bacterium]|nr:T9SS type A sorting domain-containing protein [Bacteroidales bacterium]